MIGAPRKARSRVAGVLALAALTAAGAVALPAAAVAKPSKVKVMTRNLYLGADLTPAIAAPNAPAAYRAAGDIYDAMIDTNFVARARLLAQEVDQRSPDLIGLQEVALWRRGQLGAPDGPGTPSEEVIVDFLDELTHQLEKRGLHYRVAVVQREADIEIPVDRTDDSTANPTFDGRLTMRDVTLAKASRNLRLRNRQHANFEAMVTAPTALGPIPILRGWTSVDVRKGDGPRFRFINTHLEAFHAYYRNVQARELVFIGGPADTSLPVILAGDLNSDPTDNSPETQPSPAPALQSDAYNTIIDADTYSEGPPMVDRGVAADTCCSDADLRNPTPVFDERIDHVMSRGRVRERWAVLTGVDPLLRTPTGLWPSDHAGVLSGLTVR